MKGGELPHPQSPISPKRHPPSSVVALISEFVEKYPYLPYKCHPYKGGSPPIPHLIPSPQITPSFCHCHLSPVCHCHWKIPIPTIQVSPYPNFKSNFIHFVLPTTVAAVTRHSPHPPISPYPYLPYYPIPILRTISYILFRLQQLLLLRGILPISSHHPKSSIILSLSFVTSLSLLLKNTRTHHTSVTLTRGWITPIPHLPQITTPYSTPIGVCHCRKIPVPTRNYIWLCWDVLKIIFLKKFIPIFLKLYLYF